jgi:uncharacterized protein (TIGR04141 family)
MTEKNNTEFQFSLYKLREEITIDDIQDSINESKTYYEEQELLEKYKHHSLFYNQNSTTPTWKSFAIGIAKKNEDISKKNQSASESYCLVMNKENTSSLYAITGGFGHNLISKHIDEEFGIDILSRLVKSDEKALKSSRERTLTGGILGQSKYFRTDLDFFENEAFGQFYKELQAKVSNEQIYKYFGIESKTENKDFVCTAKSSLKFNQAYDFETLISIIGKSEELLNLDPQIEFNNVRKVIKSKEKDLVILLEAELEKQLWDNYSLAEGRYPFDICHQDFELYKSAVAFELRKKTTKNKKIAERNYFGEFQFHELSSIDDFNAKLELEKNITDQGKYISLLKTSKIASFDENNNIRTIGSFYSHLFGDVEIEGTRYFFIDQNWYQIKNNFVKKLNESVSHIFKDRVYRSEIKPWGDISEGKYNELYMNDDQTFVLDKVTPNGVELCDIMKWDDSNLYLIHVKDGFGNTMRDLCNQISVAGRLYQEAINTDDNREKLASYYDQIVSYDGDSAYRQKLKNKFSDVTKDFFLSLFDKQTIFVLAIRDSAKKPRNFTKMEEFNSTIAKFSTQKLTQDMAANSLNLLVSVIPSEQL